MEEGKVSQYAAVAATGILPMVGGDQDLPITKLAAQWVAEDPLFCQETYEDDPYFDKELQADIRQAEAEFQAGKGICFDPRKEKGSV